MKTFLAVLRNNYRRTAPRIALVIMMTIVMLASVMAAVYFTGLQQVKGHIALVTQGSTAQLPKSSPLLDIQVVSERPPRSELVKQRYDAFVTVNAQGKYEIETLRSGDFNNMLRQLMESPGTITVKSPTDRGIGVNIIGFLMMFLLMYSFANLFGFAEDKEQGQLSRIAASPASFGAYLTAHCVYCLSMVLPCFIMLAVLKACGWNIGFTLPEYAGLIAMLSFLGISFALLLNTLINKPDNASMLGNATAVLTSILAGSFYSFSKNNAVLDAVVRILPQKGILDFAQHLSNGNAAQHMGSIVYTVVFALVLFSSSCVILRRMYVKRV